MKKTVIFASLLAAVSLMSKTSEQNPSDSKQLTKEAVRQLIEQNSSVEMAPTPEQIAHAVTRAPQAIKDALAEAKESIEKIRSSNDPLRDEKLTQLYKHQDTLEQTAVDIDKMQLNPF